jgi:predicted nucleic acid-binding protein
MRKKCQRKRKLLVKSEFIILGQKASTQFDSVQVLKESEAQSKESGNLLKRQRKGSVNLLSVKAYLDTNLLIEHCWWKFFGEEKGRMSNVVTLVERGFQGDYHSYISYINIMELSIHLTDWFLLEKMVRSGFSYAYFRRERKKYNLTVDEKSFINRIVQEYQSSPNVFYIEIDEISNAFFEKVKLLVDNYLEFEDALHFVFAQASESKYFVTKDDELRTRLQKIISKKLIDVPFPPTLIKPKSFLKLLNK